MEGKAGEGTQSSCISSFSLDSYAAVFTQCDDNIHKKATYVREYLLPISSPGTFKYCYSITRLNQTHVSRGKFEQVVKYEEPLILII